MKELNMLVWITQLGMGVAMPLVGFIWLGIWLKVFARRMVCDSVLRNRLDYGI